jgi:hypothetical protein
VELKTHERWNPTLVAKQLRDQSERNVARGGERRLLGSVLLAPERLCRSVQHVDPEARVISWPSLLTELTMKTTRFTGFVHAMRDLLSK